MLLAAAGMFLLALHFLRLDPSGSARDDRPQPRSVAPGPPADSSSQSATPADIAATFAARMPTGGGESVVASNGQYRLNAIRVAVPNGYKSLRYLSGTDPAAIQYLADTRAAEQKLSVDNGPLNVDTSGMAPANSGKSKRVAVPSTNN